MTVRPLEFGVVHPLWQALGRADDSLWTYMGYGPFTDRDDFEATVTGWIGSTDPLFFTFDVGGRPLGWGAYLRVEPAHGVVEVGHLVFSPDLQRTVAATEAMYLMMRHVFELGYRRYEWKCDSLNVRSRQAATRLGFTYEGTFRQHMVYKGRNRDSAWFSILDSEWPERRADLESWMDPDNFDSAGRQRRSLARAQVSWSGA